MALVSGPPFGLAGYWWWDERRSRRAVALALLGGLFVAVGLYHLWYLQDLLAGWSEVAIGILAPLLLGRSNRDRLWGLLTLPGAVLLAVLAYEFLYYWANLHS